MALAAVDCGTNSTRLLIAADDGQPIVEEARITRLGEGVHKSRRLLPAAITRTCDALGQFRDLIDKHDVRKVRAVGTSALRDATNSAEFLGRAFDALGTEIRVITGTEEAHLTYAGATGAFEGSKWHLVLDIGGGSTEFVLGQDSEVMYSHSFDVGCVRLTELALHSDPPTDAELDQARDTVELEFSESTVLQHVQAHGPDLIAVGGTATSLGALDIGLECFDANRVNGHRLSTESLQKVHAWLTSRSVSERVSPLLPMGRAEVIVAGAVVLLATMQFLKISECKVWTGDLLVGLMTTSDDR